MDGKLFFLNNLIGQNITLEYLNQIFCIACGRPTKKSFQQGYCFPCTQRLAQCDLCIVKPERCHYHLGTCREPQWGEKHCFQNHIIYLANSSGIKVGITKEKNIPTRWIDQGATQALAIFKVPTRKISGLIEILLAQYISDKTDWRKMLKGSPPEVDLIAYKNKLLTQIAEPLETLADQYPQESENIKKIECLDLEGHNTANPNQIQEIYYPVLKYPEKIHSLSFEKTPVINGVLLGIKGQYLILDIGVLNIRNMAGYQIKLTTTQPA